MYRTGVLQFCSTPVCGLSTGVFLGHELHKALKGDEFIVLLLEHTDDVLDPFAVSTDALRKIILIVGPKLPQGGDLLPGQLKGMQVEHIVVVLADIVQQQGFGKAPGTKPHIAAAGDGKRAAQDLSLGQAEFIKAAPAEDIPAQPLKAIQIQFHRVAGGKKIQMAGIVPEAQLLQYLQPVLVHAEAGSPEADHVHTEKLPHPFLCQAGIFPELLQGFGHGCYVGVAVQRQGVAVGKTGLQTVRDLGSKLAYGEQGVLDAVAVHDPDVLVKAVHQIGLHRNTGGADTFCVGKGFHIHCKNGVFFLSHSSVFLKEEDRSHYNTAAAKMHLLFGKLYFLKGPEQLFHQEGGNIKLESEDHDNP